MTTKKEKKVLVLRSVDKDGLSHGGFEWPKKGKVSAPDWNPRPECGNGLHGWLRGEGDAGASSFSWTDSDFASRLWQVVEVVKDDIVHLGGKVKFPRGVVLFTGTREDATKMIQDAYPGAAVIGGTATAGYHGTATAGYHGTATAGYRGTATAGDSGTATAGSYGTATAGDSGTATAGSYGTATAGSSGTATAGSYGTATAGGYGTATAGSSGTATAGSYGTATAGDSGTATAGGYGTATAGDSGTATAGGYGTATAGSYGIVVLSYWDQKAKRKRLVIGYVGEGGIEAGKKYKLNEKHELVEGTL